MRTVGRIGPTFEARSVWTRSRGTPAAARARYRSRKVPVDTRSIVLPVRGPVQFAGFAHQRSGGEAASRSPVSEPHYLFAYAGRGLGETQICRITMPATLLGSPRSPGVWGLPSSTTCGNGADDC